MTGFWPIFFLLVVLKIPVLGSLWLVWWAAKQNDEPAEAIDEDGGSGKRRDPRPRLPRGPRRGPHGGGAAVPAPPCPPGGRTRVVRPSDQPVFSPAGSRAGRDGSQPLRYGA